MPEAKVYISGPIVADASEAKGMVPFCTLEDVMMQLEYQKPFDTVRAIINSPGGRVDKGMGVYDHLRSLTGVKIITEAIGQCSSIATAVFLAGSERIIHPNTESLVHLPTGGIDGANAEQAQAWAAAMARCEADLLALYVDRAGVEALSFAGIMRAETKLTAQQMFDYGFATQILRPTTAMAIVMPTVYTPSADADQTPGWAQQLMSKLSMGLAAMTTALATLKPAAAQSTETAPTALDVTTTAGSVLTIDTGDRETYQVDDTVTDADGNAPADADYALQDGNTITVAGGAITVITPAATDATALAATDAAIVQIAEAVTALAGQVGAMQSKLVATTNLANRAAAAVGSKAAPARASAANDEGKEGDADPAKTASDNRAARRANRYPKQ